QVMVHGVQSEFKPVGEAELVEDVTQMVLYGLLANKEFFTNFFVAEALGDMLDYFHFAVAEKRLFAGPPGFRRGECLHDLGGHVVVQPDFPFMNAMNALDERVGGRLLQDYSACAKTHGTDDGPVVFSGG